MVYLFRKKSIVHKEREQNIHSKILVDIARIFNVINLNGKIDRLITIFFKNFTNTCIEIYVGIVHVFIEKDFM